MPYPYAAGEKVLATEYNEIVKAAGPYAADAGGTDAYAITVTPAPSSYVAGMVFHFKANTANTGPATLNVNSLGAKTIKKEVSSDLKTGDILAGQIVAVVYDGTNFQLLSVSSAPVTLKSGTGSYSGASGTQSIAHGLGVIPKFIRIVCRGITFSGVIESNGVYNGSATSTIGVVNTGSSGYSPGAFTDTANIILKQDTNAAIYQATVTVDDTNIILNWTKTGSPAQADFMWEAYG